MTAPLTDLARRYVAMRAAQQAGTWQEPEGEQDDPCRCGARTADACRCDAGYDEPNELEDWERDEGSDDGE